MTGWIKLHRKLLDHPFWARTHRFTKGQAWVDLLLRANHTRERVFVGFTEIVLEPGDLLTSQVALSKRWGWNRKTTARYLGCLASAQMLSTKTDKGMGIGKDKGFTIITITQWQAYQAEGNNNSASQGASPGTSEGTSGGRQGGNPKNVKNDKKGREAVLPPLSKQATEFISEWQNYTCFEGVRKMTDKRMKAVRLRLKDRDWSENWKAGLKKAATLKWTTGRTERRWRMTIDYFLRPDSLTKILESRDEEAAIRQEGRIEQEKVRAFERERALRENKRHADEVASRDAKHKLFKQTLPAFKTLPLDKQAAILKALPETKYATFGKPLWVAQHAERFAQMTADAGKEG